jgi:hypothetical protein
MATREHPDALRTKRSETPTGYVREIVFGPGMQADKSHSTWVKGGRQKAKYIRMSMTSEDCNRHSMVSGVLTSGSADIGVRVDPQLLVELPCPLRWQGLTLFQLLPNLPLLNLTHTTTESD